MKLKIRNTLDVMYTTGGYIGALCLLTILLIIILQMSARWIGTVIPGSTAYAGYFMAGSSFFSLAYALNKNAHIRVTIFLNSIGRFKKIGSIWCFVIATLLSGYFAYFAWKGIWVSFEINDISQDRDATPLWIPQLSMGLGTTLLFIAFVDNLINTIFYNKDRISTDLVKEI